MSDPHFQHELVTKPLDQREAFRLYASLADFLSRIEFDPEKDPYLGSGVTDKAWRERHQKKAAKSKETESGRG